MIDPATRIFIVGMNGSGTTMLLDHLNNHSKVYGFVGETRILPYFISTLNSYGDLSNDRNLKKLWDDMCGAFPFWKANKREPVPLPGDWSERGRHPAQIFDYVLQYFAGNAGKQIWCEKTPMHALHVRTLSELFPDARFIHAIRDGRDSAASFHRRYGYNPECTIFRWKKIVRAARSQGQEISDRYTEVMYDDITTDPERVLRSVCSFLGLEFERRLMTSSRKGPRMEGLDSDSIVPNSGRFKKYFSSEKLRKLEAIAGRLLNELGFEPDNKSGDRDLSGSYVWVRQTVTHIRLGIKEIPHRLRLGVRHPWKTIFGRFKSSWRQRKTNRF